MASPDLYEPLDVIGNGSFGIIRKVRRKADGQIFARKELNFERMSERDRKQIVAEVNILKDLHHEHIVRYHDRFVDRDAGILYIVMEYCGGGDLSTIIKHAQRHNRPIPEDTVWNYFMQLLLALNHCHHPNNPGRTSSTEGDGKERRAQILHRDLKPDNVFLDESNTVKLGDFGLSKALAQASFANTYVGTPYYMSPELMQEKAYDSKSDIWSLGCLIYELCALKPPFHEAKTHAELSILIRNGRIPPLPKGYSHSLTSVVKAMLNLNPAMRPSAAQLLQHERIDFALKVGETQKMLNTVKSHKATLVAKERDLLAREAAAAEKEKQIATIVGQKNEELASLRAIVATAEATLHQRVRDAVARRDEELRAMVLKQETEVAARMARREEEIMEAVRAREEEIARMWAEWERKTREAMSRAVEERMEWVQQRAEELERERQTLDGMRVEVERKMAALEAAGTEKKISKASEEVRNILAPLNRLVESPEHPRVTRAVKPPVFQTPLSSKSTGPSEAPSAMKGVILTATGEPVATPTPAELAKLFINTPKVGLNFAKIFDFDSEAESDGEPDETISEEQTRRLSMKRERDETDLDSTPTQQSQGAAIVQRPTRLRRPSIRASSSRPLLETASSEPSRSEPPRADPPRKFTRAATITVSSSSSVFHAAPPVPATAPTISQSPPDYDLSDEENLPSPFIKRSDRERLTRTASAASLPLQAATNATSGTSAVRRAPRKSGGGLRAMAVVNAANAANGGGPRTAGSIAKAPVRSSIVKAQKASEEARKALYRP
ncbi:kinase-like protein [Obba rivulosa]|uniref:non-specific serine/threonine protein kinase n=1 Tax=Obba rivulosa TaxID=1052685 RepID=A0A8E2AQA0_9APHY|nr:kinase-like protein [Obba rivulosa]